MRNVFPIGVVFAELGQFLKDVLQTGALLTATRMCLQTEPMLELVCVCVVGAERNRTDSLKMIPHSAVTLSNVW